MDAVDYAASRQVDVWYGPGWLKNSGGIVGLLTHRKCQLELEDGRLILKKGRIIVFESLIQNVKVRGLFRNFGGLTLQVNEKDYTILFYKPFYPVSPDMKASLATKWQQRLLGAGATEF